MTPPAYYRAGLTPLTLPPLWLVALVLFTVAVVSSWACGQEPAGKALPKQYLEGVRAEARNLRAEVERLQEDLVSDPAAQKDRTLYKQTEALLAEVGRFEHEVKAAATQDALLKHFDTLDAHVRTLTAAVRKAAPGGQTMQRSADYINSANEELYYALAGADNQRSGKVTERQAHAFAEAVLDLQRTAKYALASSGADRAVLIDSIGALEAAAERFAKTLQNKADLKQRQTDFGAVDKAWSRLVQGLALLKPAENVHLLRSASRVDRLHERMYRLLDIKGKRPSLSVQS